MGKISWLASHPKIGSYLTQNLSPHSPVQSARGPIDINKVDDALSLAYTRLVAGETSCTGRESEATGESLRAAGESFQENGRKCRRGVGSRDAGLEFSVLVSLER
jgi:hypothetical protein